MNSEKVADDVSQYLQEASYYLRKRGLSMEQVSKALEISEQEATRLCQEFESRIASGDAVENEVDRNLWEDVYNDSVGNEKITFVRDNGFYHCRRADLDKMESPALMAIFETSKKFLDFDMYRRYLDSKPPVGYDPMAMQRQIKRAVDLIEQVLKRRWENGGSKGNDSTSSG
ncbi:MAG TPA: hypothetical protein VGS11_05910 [Candidatus Bathyarchaeia archaeon]|nr:hypothetical protein [Candidatus Bathyarchaeia archaeon]